MVALLGLTGMIGPANAGDLGRWIGSGVERVLGGAGAGVALVVVAFLGLILATDLRTGTALRAIGRWFAAESDNMRRDRSSHSTPAAMAARAGARRPTTRSTHSCPTSRR